MIDFEEGPFGFADWQNFKTIHEYLEAQKITPEEALKEITTKIEAIAENRLIVPEPAILSCPDCQGDMIIKEVNTRPDNQTGDSSRSVWICLNSACMRTTYSENTVKQEKQLLKEK